MDFVPATYVVTLPNTDPGGPRSGTCSWQPPRDRTGRGGGPRRAPLLGLLRMADAILGNFSSALVEAPAVDVPAVNVGDRQAGRDREANVIDATADAPAVAEALLEALTPAFRETARTGRPTLADGRAGERIADIIAAWHPPSPPTKPPIRLEP